MMAHDPPRYEIGQHGALEVMALAMQQPSDRMYQRIEFVIDLSPKDTHRRLPFSWKNRNVRSLAANSGTLQLSDLPGQAGLERGGATFVPRLASLRCSMRVGSA
jgi:hypothetical protein